MTAKIEDFIQFAQEKFTSLAADESAAIQDLINELESQSDINTETSTQKLSRFLLNHETIDAQFHEFTEDPLRAPARVKIDPKDFADQLRNATKSSQPSASPNESSQSPN